VHDLTYENICMKIVPYRSHQPFYNNGTVKDLWTRRCGRPAYTDYKGLRCVISFP